jgi:hypothetical protein
MKREVANEKNAATGACVGRGEYTFGVYTFGVYTFGVYTFGSFLRLHSLLRRISYSVLATCNIYLQAA